MCASCETSSGRSGADPGAPFVFNQRKSKRDAGAPKGKANGNPRTGRYTWEAIEQRRQFNAWVRMMGPLTRRWSDPVDSFSFGRRTPQTAFL